jgi:Rha family phage regulatory protein
MNNLIGSAKTIDSREVAEMIEMRHTDLLRKIEGYIDALSQNAKLRSDDYFIESTYTAGTGKAYKCYELTKMGCEMVANKLTGDKGILFTAEYVKRFNEMEQPMSQIDIIIQSALALKTIEQEQKRLKQAQEAQEQRLLELESKQMTIDKHYYTIAGYANLIGFKGISRKLAAEVGRKASKLSRDGGYEIGKEHDARYGQVNTYHEDVLKEAFSHMFERQEG